MGPHFTYPILNHAFRLLMEGVPLMAMARNRYFMEPDGLSLDMGAFVTGLEYSAGVTAEITGKPAPAFFAAALAELGVAAADTVLIGDDLSDDIGGAQAAGIPGILRGLEQAVVPPLYGGWTTRRKSLHFHAYDRVAEEFAKLIGIDPWLITQQTSRRESGLNTMGCELR